MAEIAARGPVQRLDPDRAPVYGGAGLDVIIFVHLADISIKFSAYFQVFVKIGFQRGCQYPWIILMTLPSMALKARIACT